MFLIKTGCC
ncbi:hypothetical protein VULLAG_LOCUS23944 [Vulpes lagopus]